MSPLTEEQRKKIEENRRKVLERTKRALQSGHNNRISAKRGPIKADGSSFRNRPSSTAVTASSSTSRRKKRRKRFKGSVLVCQCVMVSRKRFCVDVLHHEELVQIFRSVPGGVYDKGTQRWNFHIDDHDKLLSSVKPLRRSVKVRPLPKNLLELFRIAEEEKRIYEFDLSRMDPVLVDALLPFQKIGVRFGIQHEGRVLLADDMGLGKTIQALAIASYFSEDWPLLVVTPSSVRFSWVDAFHQWLPSVGASEIGVIHSGKDSVPDARVVIVSYDLLSKLQGALVNGRFGSVIFDESHFLKNHKTARTKAARAVAKRASRVIMLSGTPALSRPVELFTQVSTLRPGYFDSFREYGMRYCGGRRTRYLGSSNTGELQLVLEELVMLRRMKSDVLRELPTKRRQMIVLDPSRVSTKSETFEAVRQRMRRKDLKGRERRAALLQYFHQTGVVKIPAVCDYVLDLLESGKKFLCFAHHKTVLDGICECIEKKNVDFIRIDGSVSSERRKQFCDRFQSDDACRAAVLSITAANCSITLTAASLVIFAELFWNPGILTQAEDRAHRIGQRDAVLVQYLIARGTSDDVLWPLVLRKLKTLKKVGLSEDNFKSADTVIAKSNPAPTDLDDDEFWKDLEITNFDDDDPEVMMIISAKRPKLEL